MSHQFMKEKNVFKCDIFDYISSKKGQIKKQRASSVQEGNNLFQISHSKVKFLVIAIFQRDILNDNFATVQK